MFHLSQADSKSKGSLSPQRKTKVKTFGGDVTDLVGMVMMVVMMVVMVMMMVVMMMVMVRAEIRGNTENGKRDAVGDGF